MLETLGQIKRKLKQLKSMHVSDSQALEICKKEATPGAWEEYIAANHLHVAAKEKDSVASAKEQEIIKKARTHQELPVTRRIAIPVATSVTRSVTYTIEIRKSAKKKGNMEIIKNGNHFVILTPKPNSKKEKYVNNIIAKYKWLFPLAPTNYYDNFVIVNTKTEPHITVPVKSEPSNTRINHDRSIRAGVIKEERVKAGIEVRATRDFELDWDTIEFNEGYLVIHHKNKAGNSPYPFEFDDLHVTNPKSRPSFNYLKSYLKQKAFTLQAYVKILKNELVLIDSVKLDSVFVFLKKLANDTILDDDDPTQKYHSIASMSFEQSQSKASQMTPEMFRKYKSKFIDFLVSKQSNRYLISPCSEYVVHTNQEDVEDGFFFTIQSGASHVVIVFENLNPDRATLLFRVQSARYKESLRAIYNYLTSDLTNKRLAIRQNKLKIEGTGIEYYSGCNHDFYSGWCARINMWVRTPYFDE